MRFRELVSRALRGVPPQQLIQIHPRTEETESSTRPFPRALSEEMVLEREDFGPPVAVHKDNFQMWDLCTANRATVTQEGLSWGSRILSATSRLEFGSMVCEQTFELPGLPHPAPSPLSVSHALRGLHRRALLQPCFMLQPLLGFPALELEGKAGRIQP